jgi:hypothetical protein
VSSLARGVRPLTSSRLVLVTALALVGLPAVAGAAPAGTAAPAANSTTYQDSTGEDPEAPDITTIVVSNDDAGMLSFRISIPNRPTLGQDLLIDLFVDSDNNQATGSPDLAGVDYVIELARGEASLFRWDGTDFTRRFGDPPAVTLSFSYQAGVTFRISAAELGNTKRLNFFVAVTGGVAVDPETGNLDFTNARDDVAPGGGAGLYPYEVKITPPTLVVRRLSTTPARPLAGQSFTVRMTTARSDTGAVLQNGRVTCVARAGKARLRSQVARVQGGAATCTWLIPPGAKGKTFRGTVTVVFEGLKATRTITRTIG